MRCRALALVVFGLAAAGCAASADESGSSSSHDYGGQTGSLIPSCGGIPGLARGEGVPAGDTAFVVYADGCFDALQASDVTLLDPTGAEVPFTLEPTGEGALLVRTAEALVPGRYEVTTPEASAPLVVVEPEPLPDALGTATVVDPTGCGVSIDILIDERMLPYLPLVSIDVSVDGAGPVEWFEYGSLVAGVDGTALLRLDGCDPLCLSEGPHDITLQATIAGEEVQPAPLEVSASVTCGTQSRGGGGGGGGCALAPPGPAHQHPASHMLAISSLLALGLGRRRAR